MSLRGKSSCVTEILATNDSPFSIIVGISISIFGVRSLISIVDILSGSPSERAEISVMPLFLGAASKRVK